MNLCQSIYDCCFNLYSLNKKLNTKPLNQKRTKGDRKCLDLVDQMIKRKGIELNYYERYYMIKFITFFKRLYCNL